MIHPGSLYLRMGRASDVNPHTIVHAIARRRKPGGHVYRDIILPKLLAKAKEPLPEFEECRLQVTLRVSQRENIPIFASMLVGVTYLAILCSV